MRDIHQILLTATRLRLYSHSCSHWWIKHTSWNHYSDVIMSVMVSQITGVSIVYSTVCTGTYKKTSKAPRHWPLWGEFIGDRWFPVQRASYQVTRKMFLCDDVFMMHLETMSSCIGDQAPALEGLYGYFHVTFRWVQERRNSSALAMELRLSCTNPSICSKWSITWVPILMQCKPFFCFIATVLRR